VGPRTDALVLTDNDDEAQLPTPFRAKLRFSASGFVRSRCRHCYDEALEAYRYESTSQKRFSAYRICCIEPNWTPYVYATPLLAVWVVVEDNPAPTITLAMRRCAGS
jgi:hypothetical protein